MTNQRHGSDVQLARSPIGGKKTSEVKYRCADELKFELQRQAHALGMSESELSELFTAIGLFGIEHVKSVAVQKLESVGKMFPHGAGDVALR